MRKRLLFDMPWKIYMSWRFIVDSQQHEQNLKTRYVICLRNILKFLWAAKHVKLYEKQIFPSVFLIGLQNYFIIVLSDIVLVKAPR